MLPRFQWLQHRFVLTATEVAHTHATFLTFGKHGEGVSFGYMDTKPQFFYEPWKVHSFSSWVVDANGFLKEGQVVVLGEMCSGQGDQFFELASACQGPGVKARFLSDVGYPVTHGLFVELWRPVVADQVVFTRIKYERMLACVAIIRASSRI
jgi:hypothetical protein